MTKTYGYKNGDSVASEVVRMLLDGRLRSGDRIDRNELATELGVSRAPVQEALLQLERDGLITTRYHRGAYVEPWNAEAIQDQYAVWGLLNGEAAARVAVNPTTDLIPELESILKKMHSCNDPDEFDALGFDFRRRINDASGGPRLRAALRGFLTFMPEAFRVLFPTHIRVILPYYAEVLAAIKARRPERARRAEQDKSAAMASLVIDALTERGVIQRDQFVEVVQ